ncbi:MAG: trypsin-like peptidase domain-containing protein [Verrucomicrobiales bacterium]|nr:trypsin-like peptidase domain-containing protein [Verrucomicrobiales bacterium]
MAGLLAGSITLADQPSIEKLEERARQLSPALAASTVSLKSAAGQWGSGVFVSKSGVIFTAAHTFSGKNGETVRVFQNGKKSQTATVVKIDLEKDIAVLKLNDSKGTDNFVNVSLATNEACTTPYIAAGHATGFDPNRIAPVRFGFGYTSPQSGRILSTCRVNVGDSGGPLFNLDGGLVAIHRAMDASGKYTSHVPVTEFFTNWPELAEIATPVTAGVLLAAN